ncbi:MAG TPA: hypothetical protein VGO08_03970 [Burkholderiales bacterium]|jgi:hypothetical protein|nr:hypothetical protein [Burkholderiales bacterium]
MRLLDRHTRSIRNVKDVLEELWDATLDERVPTPTHQVRTETDRFLLDLGENRQEGVVIEVAFTPRLTYHYNTISLATIQGFMDEQAGTLVPGTYETTPLDTRTITKEWPATTQKDQVPFTPVEFLYLLGFLHRTPRTPQAFTLLRSYDPIEGAIPL